MLASAAVSGTNRWWLYGGAGMLAIGAAFALDNAVTSACFLPVHGPAWQAAHAISKFGDWPPILLVGLIITASLAVARQSSASRWFLLILLAGLLTGLASMAIRSTTGRTRPSAIAPQGFYGPRYQGHWIIGKYEFGSFPSGHTATWAGLAGAAWYRRRPLGITFLLGGVIVAWSRMALGCHHFSDVTAAMVWGLLVGPWMVVRLEKPVYALCSKLGLPSPKL
jgi:membrane-associated phospholipid phosphatase